ncbi:phosphotransferase enzyme family protein [Ophiostoma piceae UAMH 11346]|uniref:Phosphotransferase enzyme family protein n=1 Tax=Ophiostoma piceae (strain UAMH 11346) TaxID=1262450 RepID=S3BWC7_OPHP1|nr:phosphotransferase enzyme family protein [Ophiostoma piceae UAMH 11346]
MASDITGLQTCAWPLLRTATTTRGGNKSSTRSSRLQLSDEQEREVFKWATKEHSGGTVVVREPLINWFAERVLHRDGVGDDHALAPDFAPGFLERYPDLAERLANVPPPVPEQPRTKPAEPLRGIARSKDMHRQHARRLLYGDSPPLPRQPAPYPKGEIIHNCLDCFIVRYGNTVVKYTTNRNGFSTGDHPNEALAKDFVREHTAIPGPVIICSDWDRITVEYLGRLDGQGVVLPSITPRSGGPFRTKAEFHAWLVQPPVRQQSQSQSQSMYWH